MIDSNYVAGIDIGGTRIKLGIIDISEKKILQKSVFLTPKSNKDVFLDLLKMKIQKLCKMSDINYRQ